MATVEQVKEPKPQKPLARMIGHIGAKLETLEACYAIPAEDGQLTWKLEAAKTDHEILIEVFKTLTLVQTFEPDFRAILRKKMPTAK